MGIIIMLPNIMASRRSFGRFLPRIQSFDPVQLGLPASFNLLDYAQLKG